jgi:hypothetical protein
MPTETLVEKSAPGIRQKRGTYASLMHSSGIVNLLGRIGICSSDYESSFEPCEGRPGLCDAGEHRLYVHGRDNLLTVKGPAGTVVYAASSFGRLHRGDVLLALTPGLDRSRITIR